MVVLMLKSTLPEVHLLTNKALPYFIEKRKLFLKLFISIFDVAIFDFSRLMIFNPDRTEHS